MTHRDPATPTRRDIRLAPASGDVVDRCRPGAGSARGGGGGCGCGKDLGPMEDHEEPSQEDIDRFSGVTRICPSCKEEISDDADICYLCGEALSSPTNKSMPRWAIITGCVVGAGLLLMLLTGGRLF